MYASRQWFLPSAEPDIHSQSRAPVGRHRRLSMCSLPVPKQFGESLGSWFLRSVGNLQDLAACALCNPVYFLSRVAVRPPRPGDLPPARSPVLLDPQPANTPPSSELPPASLDWHSLSAFRFHRPVRTRDPVEVRAWRLPPGHAGYVCCVVGKVESAPPFRLISFRPRKARSN